GQPRPGCRVHAARRAPRRPRRGDRDHGPRRRSRADPPDRWCPPLARPPRAAAMTFLWLGLLVLLAIVPAIVGVYAWSLRRRRRAGARYSSLALLRDALPGSARMRRHLPFALFAAAASALVLALGRPAMVLSVPANQTTIILSMDVSGSMCSTDISPT